MDAAKQAVNKIIGKSGHHDTEVDEHVRPVVTEEHVRPHRHEETTQAVDREVHQDHYHTTVQPLTHKETLPEKHTHQQAPVQEREFRHGDSDKIRAGVEREVAQFADSSTTHHTTQSRSEAPTVAGEHVHHHVHEVVQPVVHKETVQPEVVHTTIPIHETHHAQSEHHGISTLPTKTLDEFKQIGGSLTGASHRHEEYEGHPRPYNPELQASRSPADRDPAAHDGSRSGLTGSTGTTGGLTGSHGTGTTGGLTGSHGTHSGTTGGLTGASGTTGGLTGSHGTTGGLTGSSGTTGDSTGSHGTTSGLTGSHGTAGGLTGGSGTTGGLTGSSGTTGGLTGSHGSDARGVHASSDADGDMIRGNVSGSSTTGTGLSSTGAGATGTALGGRAEGNTASRALDAVSGHDTSHTSAGTGLGSGTTGTSGVGSEGVTGRGLEHGATSGSTGLTGSHHDRGHTDTSTSTNRGGTGAVSDDVQTPRQGKDPNLVESSTKTSGGLKGEGVDGSHSAVFGLTPDGHKHDDTSHSQGTLRPAHSTKSDSIAATANRDSLGDIGSRAPTGSAVASQMHDPKVNEPGHGGSSLSDTIGSSKPGAGHPGGEQGFGTVRPEEHGGTTKIQDKVDPRTDADNDGKKGFMD